jgi:hypothetical protein
MKRFVITVAIAILVAGAASAQSAGTIKISADMQGTACNLVDTGGLVVVYLFHVDHDSASASQFMLDVTDTGWNWLGDNIAFGAVIGATVIGVSIGYVELVGRQHRVRGGNRRHGHRRVDWIR